MKPFREYLKENINEQISLPHKNTKLVAERHGYTRHHDNNTYIKLHPDTPNKYTKLHIRHDGSWRYYGDSRETEHDHDGNDHNDLKTHLSGLNESAYDSVVKPHGYNYDPEDVEHGHTWKHPEHKYTIKLHKGFWKHFGRNNKLLGKGDNTDDLHQHLADKNKDK